MHNWIRNSLNLHNTLFCLLFHDLRDHLSNICLIHIIGSKSYFKVCRVPHDCVTRNCSWPIFLHETPWFEYNCTRNKKSSRDRCPCLRRNIHLWIEYVEGLGEFIQKVYWQWKSKRLLAVKKMSGRLLTPGLHLQNCLGGKRQKKLHLDLEKISWRPIQIFHWRWPKVDTKLSLGANWVEIVPR